jgi:hypothetical protein
MMKNRRQGSRETGKQGEKWGRGFAVDVVELGMGQGCVFNAETQSTQRGRQEARRQGRARSRVDRRE